MWQLPYSAKLWQWKSLTKFDESSMSECLMSKTLTNWLGKVLTRKTMEGKTLTNTLFAICQIRQTFPPPKFCAIRYICNSFFIIMFMWQQLAIFVLGQLLPIMRSKVLTWKCLHETVQSHQENLIKFSSVSVSSNWPIQKNSVHNIRSNIGVQLS